MIFSARKLLPLLLALVLGFGSGCRIGGSSRAAGHDQAAAAGPSARPGPGQWVFRLAEAMPADYPATIGDFEFARLVEERSRGRIKIMVTYGAKLGDETSVMEQVQFGGVEFARLNGAVLVYRPMSVLSLPYLFKDADHLWKVLYGPIGDELLAGLAEKNLVGLTYYTSAARSFYTKKPVRTVADMRGLRIRVQPSKLYMDLIRSLGAEPVPISFSEVYNALLLGKVDGAENNWASYYAGRHYQLAKYYIVDTHTRTPEVLMANKTAFERLSKADQALIRAAARDSVKKEWRASAAMEADLEAEVRRKGGIVIHLADAEKEKFKKAVEPLYLVHGREYKRLIERIRATE